MADLRTLTDADVAAIVEQLAARLGGGPPVVEVVDEDPKVRPEDMRWLAERRQRMGGTKRRATR